MYESYWGLQRRPFQNDADPEFFFRGRNHQGALLKLQYVIDNRLGAGMLLGATGAGKTQLVRVLDRESAEGTGPFVHLVFPQLAPPALLAYLGVELGADEAELDGGEERLDRTVRVIGRQFVRHAEAGRRPVIVVDEAHLIEDVRVFQTLHLLLNLSRQSAADVTLILIGEPALAARIGRVPQLDERIAVKGLLQPLDRSDTAGYIAHRLSAAGATRPLFAEDALQALFELSGGVPRRINRLCDLALLVGYADRLDTLTAAEIEAVSEELTTVIAA